MKPRKSRALVVREASIQQAVTDYLRLDGWRVFHWEYGFDERSKKTHGEPGMPDLLCIRYRYDGGPLEGIDRELLQARGDILWIELKSLTGDHSAAQRIWQKAERERGALVWVAGEEFPRTVEGFIRHYEQSGLQRRKIEVR